MANTQILETDTDSREPFQFSVKQRLKPENSGLAFGNYNEFIRQCPAPEWITEIRRRGEEKVSRYGLPTSKLERWKYTNLNTVYRQKYHVQLPAVLNPELPRRLDGNAHTLVMVNGIFQAQSSNLPDGIHAGSLKSFIESGGPYIKDMLGDNRNDEEDMTLVALNDAWLNDGIVIHIPKNKRCEDRLEIYNVMAGPVASHPRVLIVLEEGASLNVFECISGDSGWQNRVTQVRMGANSRLHHITVQSLNTAAYFTENQFISQQRDSRYSGLTFGLGGGIVRKQSHATLKGSNCECHIDGTYTIAAGQHNDTTILIEHQEPHCFSNQTHKGVLAGKARGVFQGKIHVHQKAQKTDGYQLNNTLLLSDQAEMDTKPELEIYADDVRCSHGATTGQLDEDPLFYMRARGIPDRIARKLLMQSFLGEVVDKIEDETVRDHIGNEIERWLDNVENG